jgi:DNA topoisomerase-1
MMNSPKINRRRPTGEAALFKYYGPDGNPVRDKNTLERIRQLAIPPQWEDVMISTSDTDYLQATGVDSKRRLQYIYHPMWNQITKDDKYKRMGHFAQKMDEFNNRLREDQSLISTMFRIIQKTHIRIGNDSYAKENGTYGLCTLEKKHVTVAGDNIRLRFIGKKGIEHDISFRDARCANTIRHLLKLPGPRLFKIRSTSVDALRNISSQDLNEYLQATMGPEFTCKDFRTYASNLLFLQALVKIPPSEKITERRKTLRDIFNKTAEKLGHTNTISKKSYVMPVISENYLTTPEMFYGKDPKKLLLNLAQSAKLI